MTGIVSLLDESEEKDALGREGCGGFLNPNCVSVGDIAQEPWQPGCSMVAVGHTALVQNQIWEVCDGAVRRAFATIVTEMNHPPPPGAPLAAVSFMKLASSGNDVWSENSKGLYRFSGSPTPKFVPFPHFQAVEDLWVSFELPGLALVQAASGDPHASLSSPLLSAPRPERLSSSRIPAIFRANPPSFFAARYGKVPAHVVRQAPPVGVDPGARGAPDARCRRVRQQ